MKSTNRIIVDDYILTDSYHRNYCFNLGLFSHVSSNQRPGILQTALVPKPPAREPLRPSVPPANPLLKLSILYKDSWQPNLLIATTKKSRLQQKLRILSDVLAT